MKKAALILTIVLIPLFLIIEATAAQLLSFAAIGILMWFNLYQKSQNEVWIIIIGVMMTLINIALLSWVDVAYWVFIIIAYARKG